LYDQRRVTEALAQFQKAVELDPTDVYAHARLGGISQDLGNLDEAINQFNQAIRLKPDYADGYSNLGNCYGMKGRTDDAIVCFQQAVKLKPLSARTSRTRRGPGQQRSLGRGHRPIPTSAAIRPQRHPGTRKSESCHAGKSQGRQRAPTIRFGFSLDLRQTLPQPYNYKDEFQSAGKFQLRRWQGQQPVKPLRRRLQDIRIGRGQRGGVGGVEMPRLIQSEKGQTIETFIHD